MMHWNETIWSSIEKCYDKRNERTEGPDRIPRSLMKTKTQLRYMYISPLYRGNKSNTRCHVINNSVFSNQTCVRCAACGSPDRDAHRHPAVTGALPVWNTHQALCWKTCRGSVRKRVPNWGLFTSPPSEPAKLSPVSPGSSAGPATARGAAMLEVTRRKGAGRLLVLRSQTIGARIVLIFFVLFFFFFNTYIKAPAYVFYLYG